MVRQHVLIGLGFKKQNFRNRAIRYMMNKKGSGFYVNNGSIPSNQMTIMPVAPTMGLPRLSRQPLKFNY
jgi:hypothetical protein